MKIRFLLFILTSLPFCHLIAQNSVFELKKDIIWPSNPATYLISDGTEAPYWTFEGAARHQKNPRLPVVSFRFPVSGSGNLDVQISNERYEPFNQLTSTMAGETVQSEIEIFSDVSQSRKDFFGNVSILPIRKTAAGTFERLVYFKIDVRYLPGDFGRPPPPPNTFNSVLESGKIYKIAVSETGVHQLTYDFLKNTLEMDLDNINPNHIRLYGNGGGMLPLPIEATRADDLVENPIQVIGAADNSFDEGDYILFYGEGPDKWYFNENTQRFVGSKNAFDNNNYYFIKVDNTDGLRMAEQNSIDASAFTVNSFDDFKELNDDRVNLLASEKRSAHGTGKAWYGDKFSPTRQRSYNFDFPNRIPTAESDISVRMCLRAPSSSRFNVTIAGSNFQSANTSGVNMERAESPLGYGRILNDQFTGGGDQLTVTINYPGIGDQSNSAWLDYIQLNVRRALTMTGDQMAFRNIDVVNYPNASYQVAGINGNHEIWDITNPLEPKIQRGNQSGNSFNFGVNVPEGNPLKTFIAFNKQSDFLTAEAVGEVVNQNIHGIRGADLVIVYHPEFETAVQQLAEHRRNHSGLNVVTVTVGDIYNEFSSGRQDPAAIRDFNKMLSERDPNYKYFLLFGDGSYDYRNITGNSVNFVPVYENNTELDPIFGFPADDFFVLLSDDEGSDELNGDIDIAVGRIPARDNISAQGVVDKIIFYDTNPNRLRDWRNQLVFVGDDGDNNRHSIQANKIADSTAYKYEVYNINKVLFDAFQKLTTAGGTRIPKANESINRSVFLGNLITNYLGHGGSTGWAQERVLQVEDIESWSNTEKHPLIVTATCSFAGYDDHDVIPGGEIAMMKTDGGAIALFTTVRAVFSTSNFRLTKAVFDLVLESENGNHLPMGEILRQAKNNTGTTSDNSRKFVMLGDPSQRLGIPRHHVGTSTINGRDVNQVIQNDTMRALEKIKITGFVYDDNGNVMSDFNGKVYPTIYDKSEIIETLGQPVDQTSNAVMDFELRKNILFKGVATVTNGLFEFEFIMPKDINYEFGRGKISYYAENGVTDANGFYDKVIIGGTNPNAPRDNEGPIVEVFMNNEDFVSGGMTDKDPTLYAKLSDDFGINIGGISIGHDLAGILDNNTQDTYILNDFYTAELDDYTKGSVRFPLYDIPEGLHRISVKAWDTSNNSGEGYTEFLVANSEESALRNVLNYPNPFTTNTNFQFEHLLQGQDLNVLVQIFTVSGKLVKTIEKDIFADGYRVTDVPWDGLDDYGGRLGRGVYLYKIKVKGTNSKEENAYSESDFQKLVILK